MKTIFVLLPVAALMLTACENNQGPISPDFGNAVHHNMSVHIINPRTPNPSAAAPGMSGARAVGVIKRYNEGTPADLEIEKTGNK